MTDKHIALSGGFDPVHVGHIAMIDDAAAFGKVLIILNSDAWLMRKKSFVFMPFEQRKRVLESMRNVNVVLSAQDEDDTVCASIDMLKFTIAYFGNGGDRVASNTPEADICFKYDIPIIYGLGGSKLASSSKLVSAAHGS